MKFNDSQAAFNNAIQAGFLSKDPEKDCYAGLFMYMHSEESNTGLTVNCFKHIHTREYCSFTHV